MTTNRLYCISLIRFINDYLKIFNSTIYVIYVSDNSGVIKSSTIKPLWNYWI